MMAAASIRVSTPPPSTRSVQSISFPTHTTTSLTITVLSTVPGSAVGDQDASDRTAISEVEIRS